MDFLDLVQKRYSVREYSDTPVSDVILNLILETAHFAPSACNLQPWIFIVSKDVEMRQRFSSVYNRSWFINAPVIIAICCDRSISWKRDDGKDFGDIDCAIAFDHLTLAAAEKGLGTCWIGAFNIVEAKKVLYLPEHIDPIALTPLGYPSQNSFVKNRKTTASCIYLNAFKVRKA